EDSMVPVKLFLWDLHGFHDTWNSVARPGMFRRKTAIIFVADLETLHLDEIQFLLDLSASEDVLERVLVGNKADAAAPGNTEEAEVFATANGLTYFEASAKDHESVDVVLRHILLSVMDKLELNLTPFRSDRILVPDPPPERSRCEVLQRARASLGFDPKIRLQLLFEDRPLQTQETLASLGLPGPPFQVDLQLLHQPRLVERIDMQTSDFQQVCIGICGQHAAGKTSFLNQYVDHRFHAERVDTVISVDFKVVNLRVEKEKNMVPVKLLVWDLHGSHHAYNPVLHPIMFRHKAAIIFVADLERLHLDEIQRLLDLSASEDVLERVLVGNKADVAAPGNTEEAEAFATANGLTYFEASAKNHESVDVVLRHILLSVMDKMELKLTPFRRDGVLAPDPPPERLRCALQ
ncbi:RAB12, partial [Symbiodinium microadriaticum]